MLNLDENYAIKCDDDINVELVKKRVIKEGKRAGEVDWDNVGNYSSLPAALRKYATLEINSFINLGVNAIIQKIDELYKKIEEVKVCEK